MKYSADYFLLQQNGLATEFMWRLSTELGKGAWNKYSINVGALLAEPGETALSKLTQMIADRYVEELLSASERSETAAEKHQIDALLPSTSTHSLEITEYHLVPKEEDQS